MKTPQRGQSAAPLATDWIREGLLFPQNEANLDEILATRKIFSRLTVGTLIPWRTTRGALSLKTYEFSLYPSRLLKKAVVRE